MRYGSFNQIQTYEKEPPIMKYTDITKKFVNFSQQLENIKTLQEKSIKYKKIIKTLEQPLQYWEMGVPTYQIQMYQKAPPITKYTNITQKFPNLS